ncbi:hypothetical protein HS125_19870 [bacterium]|nr:hypothetical protein [bacterium]
MKKIVLLVVLVPLMGVTGVPAQTRNPLEASQKLWYEKIMNMGGGVGAASVEAELPGLDLPDFPEGPKTWDGQPQVVEEAVFDPPAPYFETAQYYRILTPISFTATKGEDYSKPTGDGNAALDYWRLFSGAPTRASYDLFVTATRKRNCEFFAPGLLVDPFGYENSNLQFWAIFRFLDAQWRASGERVRAGGTRVKMDFCHQMLTFADHIDSQQMNIHWAWIAFYVRRLATSGLTQYYRDKGDAAMAQKYQRYGAASLTYYRTLRRRYEELSRSFVEGDVDQFSAYVKNGPNREIVKELLLLSGVMLRVAEDLSTAEEIQQMGHMVGWPSVKVMRYTKIRPRHFEAMHATLTELADPKNPAVDESVRKCAQWALSAEQDSLVSKLRARNEVFLWQNRLDPNETGL